LNKPAGHRRKAGLFCKTTAMEIKRQSKLLILSCSASMLRVEVNIN
jgi:hypothetical protein